MLDLAQLPLQHLDLAFRKHVHRNRFTLAGVGEQITPTRSNAGEHDAA